MGRASRKKSLKRAAGETRAMPGPRFSRVHPAWLRFALTFPLLCLAFYSVIGWLPESSLAPVNRHTAWTLWGALKLVGVNAVVRDTVVSAAGFAVSVIPECTVLFAVGLFGCFLAAYPASWKQKALGLLIGIPALYVLNLARLQVVFLAGWINRSLFELLHVYLGQILTVGFVFLACWTWLRSLESAGEAGGRLREVGAFTLRFLAVSAVLFFIWIQVNRGYVALIDGVMVWGFELAGRTIEVGRRHEIYYPTFSVVLLVSLIGSTSSVAMQRRLKAIGAGLAALFLLHLAHRVCNVFLVAYGAASFDHWAVIIRACGQYLLPVLVWLALVKPGLGRKPREAEPGPDAAGPPRRAVATPAS